MNCQLIMQGDSYYTVFRLKENGKYIDINTIKRIQFKIGELIKYYESEGVTEVTYHEDLNEFHFPLSQSETFNFDGPQKTQIRIKFKDDTIRGKHLGELDIMFSDTKEEI